MKLRNRFLLVGFGVLVFLIVTPILVIYARGFKIDWENRALVKTGALVIKTEPNKTDIYLDDEKLSSQSPANVRFLLPDDYSIRLEKEGYQSWTKRLTVKSQIVTWANNNRDFVTLFYKNPALENTWTGNNIIATNNEIAFIENEQPTQINIENGETKKIDTLPSPITTTEPAEEISALLTSLNIPVPPFTSSKIIRAGNQIYLILDQTLYLVNDSLEKIYSPVTNVVWHEDVRQLLFSNINEAYIYYTEFKDSDLILRSITPISNPVLNPVTGYLFFQNEGKIKAIELDDRDHRNIFTIADALEKFSISNDGKKLFVYSTTEIKQYTIR